MTRAMWKGRKFCFQFNWRLIGRRTWRDNK